jgi:hypothetical protein
MTILLGVSVGFSTISLRYMMYGLGSILGLYVLYVIWFILQIVIEKIRKKPYQPKPKTDENAYPSLTSSNIFKIASTIWYPFIVCSSLGSGEAYRETKFQVVRDSVNYIVIRKYGDQFICKELTKKNDLGNTTKIFKVSDSKPFSTIEQELRNLSVSHNDAK